jgi:hypothetical protein
VAVLDFQPDWGISQIFPSGQGDWFVQIEPGREELLPLQASLPEGFDDGLDVLKVFATLAAANFSRLALPALGSPATRSTAGLGSATFGHRNALEDLLDAISGERPPITGTRTFTAAAYPSGEWTTYTIEIRVRSVW